jgi:threonine dehydrogenase-like Zn-dependent dehydrogenase
MQAIVYDIKPVGWLTCQWLKHFWPGCLLSGLNGFSLRDVPPPELPTKHWVRLRTLLGGICGSDLALVAQKQPPDSLLQAYSSMPMILGHENVAVVDQLGPGVDSSWLGRRVLVEPTLGCQARQALPMCDRCNEGNFGVCENFSASYGGLAELPPGTSIGYNSATGGSWGEFFVAHESQLIPLGDDIPDDQAILVDPLACSLHAVGRANLAGARSVLIYGAGVLGLGVAGALRAVDYTGRIEILDRHDYLKSSARRMGADEFFTLPDETQSRFEQIAGRTGGRVQRVRFGNYMLAGGYDLVFDCVGSAYSVMECMKWTRPRGQLVMLGTLQGKVNDLTPVWFSELTVIGAYGRAMEHYHRRRVGTYDLVLELIRSGKLNPRGLLTHRFGLGDYKQALRVAMDKSANHSIKVAFDFQR